MYSPVDMYGLLRAVCCLQQLIMQQSFSLIKDKQYTMKVIVV
jgi:hypothetical protein